MFTVKFKSKIHEFNEFDDAMDFCFDNGINPEQNLFLTIAPKE